MTRGEAAKRLGVARARLAELERDGVAKPERDARNVPNFSEAEVERLAELGVADAPQPRRRTSRRAAAAAAAPTPRSPMAAALAADAELLETGGRLELARQRLDELQGVRARQDAVAAALAAALEREQARQRADEAERQRHAERDHRIGEIVGHEQHALLSSGWPASPVLDAVGVARAVLLTLTDAELAGEIWPRWIAHTIVSDVLRFDRPPVVPVPVLVDSPSGPVQIGWRPAAPGD